MITLAAALAAFTSVSAAAAQDRGPGHWEWQSRPTPGPNKSNLPSRVRVWVNDAPTVANCDCAMTRDTAMAADCMAMPHKGGSASHG
ncbi:MAG: hypothetical protein IT552_14795 [Sphingomonadaceae bacterium]|nr:hypothetical protein [Sphingomonadaceae bacterium]